MKVSGKLAIGFSVVLIATVVVGLIGITGMREMRESEVFMYENRVRGIEFVYEAQNHFNEMRVSGRNTIINSFYDDRKGAVDSNAVFEYNAEGFLSSLEKCREIADSEELLKFYDRIQELFVGSYLPTARSIHGMCIGDIPDHHNKLYIYIQVASATVTARQIENLLLGLFELNSALARQSGIDNTWLTQQYAILLISIILAAVAIIFIVAYFVIRSISVPIKESAAVLTEIARGNFEARVKGDYKDEFKIIKASVNNTAQQLADYLDEKMRVGQAEAVASAMRESITYASKIQRNLLPSEDRIAAAFSDYSVIWKPRDIVGGDLYWMKQFEKGTVLCVCDCTGHGTPGALLTMLVASTLDGTVWPSNCDDTAGIIWRLDQRLSAALHVESGAAARRGIMDIDDGCDIAAVFVANDDSIKFSSGKMPIFVCDGKDVVRYKGQKIFVGEGKLKSKDEVAVHSIPANPDNKFYITTDGLTDQIGGVPRGGELRAGGPSGAGRKFGYNVFKQIILECHYEAQSVATGKVWDAFELFRGEQARRDDVTLVAFKP